MKLSLALTTVLLSSTALANSFEIDCFDQSNSKLFTINSISPSRTSITWADGSSDPVNFTKTESVKSGGCLENYSLELKLQDIFQSSEFDISVASHWSEGKPRTRCAGMGSDGLFEGTLSKQGKTVDITCKYSKVTEL